MPGQLPRALGRSAGDLSFAIFLVTVALSLLRARELPAVDIGLAGTTLSITPTDVLLAATAVLALLRLRGRRPLPGRSTMLAVAAFAALVLLSALPNGAVAVVAAAKLIELGALVLGAAAFLDTGERLRALFLVLVTFTAVAVCWGLIGFVTGDRSRQASFMGEHDLAALATIAIAIGLARVHGRRGFPGALAVVGIAAGTLGVVLGAALASLLGVYLAAAAITYVAYRRRELRWAAAAATIAVAAVATAGTLALRQGDLGFIQSWFGPPAETPGQYAASWSQRLIFVYVGGRVFLDNPVVGTGWHGVLPPEDFAQYLPDARERFSDQPPHYFPPEDGAFIPQQTYDQLLFQLGLLGAAVFLLLAVLAALRAARAAGRRLADAAYMPLAWLASLAGVLAGAALFGGSPLAAIFWLTLGVVAAEPEAT